MLHNAAAVVVVFRHAQPEKADQRLNRGYVDLNTSVSDPAKNLFSAIQFFL
jgi:hypothetical protein